MIFWQVFTSPVHFPSHQCLIVGVKAGADVKTEPAASHHHYLLIPGPVISMLLDHALCSVARNFLHTSYLVASIGFLCLWCCQTWGFWTTCIAYRLPPWTLSAVFTDSQSSWSLLPAPSPAHFQSFVKLLSASVSEECFRGPVQVAVVLSQMQFVV